MRSISKNHFCKYNILCKKMYTSFRNVAPESLNFLSICNWELFLLWSFIVDDDGKFITFDFRLTNLWNHSKKRKIFGEWYVLFNELLTSILFFSLIFWQEIFLLSGKNGIKVFLGLFLLLMWLKYWKLLWASPLEPTRGAHSTPLTNTPKLQTLQCHYAVARSHWMKENTWLLIIKQ